MEEFVAKHDKKTTECKWQSTFADACCQGMRQQGEHQAGLMTLSYRTVAPVRKTKMYYEFPVDEV